MIFYLHSTSLQDRGEIMENETRGRVKCFVYLQVFQFSTSQAVVEPPVQTGHCLAFASTNVWLLSLAEAEGGCHLSQTHTGPCWVWSSACQPLVRRKQMQSVCDAACALWDLPPNPLLRC